jgi:hypothetical protein
MKNGSATAVQDGTLLNEAAESLLAQMGVTLTETGRRTLRAGRYMAARAEAGYARGMAAEAGGAAVEALLNYSQAVAFDPSRLEALSRLGSVSSEISGGSVSAHILNDIQARRAWLEACKEAAAFFNSHPPFEIGYDPNLLQIGVTDYAKEQADLAMRVSLAPSEAGFGALNALVGGLEKTGKRELWGFAGWPLLDITPKTPEAIIFPGKTSFSFAVEAGLVNEHGKVIARGKTTLVSGALGFKAGDPAVQAPGGVFGQIDFPKVHIADLTPTLTVVIAGVNGLSGRQISETGYMRIAPEDIGRLIEEEAKKVFEFVLEGDSYAVAKYKGNDAEVRIPAGIDGIPVTSIGNSAFDGCNSLTSVSIPSSVTSIGNSAFDGCSSLTSISIPPGVTSIGDWAFSFCSNLTSISIPSSVTSIGSYAFSFCSSLTSISIPSGVTSIGSSAFRSCSSLSSAGREAIRRRFGNGVF